MIRALFILVLVVPLLEIYLLIQVGGLIGAIPTIALVVFTAVFGALLLRWQSFAIFQQVRLALGRGELPAIEMLEGVALVISGVLLLTPGFFTDAIGFLLVFPPLRRHIIGWLISRSLITTRSPDTRRDAPDERRGPRTIEGEYWKEKEREKDQR